MTDAEKLNAVMNRTGADRKTAAAALETSDGDVDIAVRIIRTYDQREDAQVDDSKTRQEGQRYTGEEKGQGASDEQIPLASDILNAIKEIWKKGNASRLDIEKGGKSLLSISLTIGTIGLILAPVAALIGIGAALITDYKITITLDNGTVVDVNEFAVKNKENNEQQTSNK